MATIGTITPTPGAFQSAPKAADTGQLVVKFDGTGNIVYGTYLGGSDQDFPQGLATDSNGNVYLTGFTRSDRNGLDLRDIPGWSSRRVRKGDRG